MSLVANDRTCNVLIDDPFPVTRYTSHPLFCDREEELAILTGALRNGHTYHVQVLFNRLFGDARPSSRDTIVQVMLGIVREQDAVMATLRSTLPGNQGDLFAAIAREDAVDMPTSGAFMRKHVLASSAAMVQAMKALLDKELVYITGHAAVSGKPVYETYDPFLRNWFRYRRAGCVTLRRR